MKLGILTGGGDVPGLNPCIKEMVHRSVDAGHQVVGIRHGWGGLLNYNPQSIEDQSEWVVPLTKPSVRTIDRFGGTFLHTSRTNPGRVRVSELPAFLEGRFTPGDNDRVDATPHVLEVLQTLGITVLAPIGGDDTL